MKEVMLLGSGSNSLFWGGVLGYLLILVLTLIKQLIQLHNSPVIKEFAEYAYWILAGGAVVALSIGYVSPSEQGDRVFSTLCFYTGLLIPFIWRARKPGHQSLDGALSSEALSKAALFLWIVSLFFPVAIKHGHKITMGWNLLTSGWIGPLRFQFAWYANPLFLISFLRLQSSQSTTGPAFLALMLSLNTITFFWDNALSYSYGWGLLLWFMALFLMVAAAGAFEISKGEERELGEWLRSLGLVAAILIVGIGISL
ncbi:hypothetical protein PSCICO_39780 [Pseudomonas cichorii]|uniref:hypothetical protein n=1 Tax=Pseudomonas cichorii TaxID=36746 RepID=UPI0019110D91|nr:hypothetical protein [Pseudomonas cichorii]GFM88579.1 hypothetical protein PSCICO_39780 [Pseudomonas cichorii]